ncbi:MAG: hypothetical protein IAE80_20905, partial [Anaerolinea sp.]|nr:hypothetical protein [Anaerolinea sp.]
LITLLLSGLAAARLLPFDALRSLLLFNYAGSADTALGIMILLALINVSFMLVLMVSVLAREIWAIPAVWLLALINVALLLIFGWLIGAINVALGVLAGIGLLREFKTFRVNPVMLKELRGRMRGMRAFAVITVYLGLMSGFAALIYLVYGSSTRASGSAAAGEIGRVLFLGIVGIELLLIIFIAPAFTAGAITGERERQTYDLLKTTLLSTPSFVIGKLESALGYILLLLLAAIPLQSIAFLFGGVSEAEVVLSFIILTVTAVALGTVGIYFSAAMARTLNASVRAYSAILVIMFVAPVVLGVVLNLINELLFIRQGLLLSPGMEAIFRYLDLLLTSINPIATGLTSQQLLVNQGVLGFYPFTLASNGSTIPMVSPWITFAILYLAASAVLIVLTIRNTRKVEL